MDFHIRPLDGAPLPRFRLSLLAACILPAFMACSGPDHGRGRRSRLSSTRITRLPKPDLSRIRQIRFLTEDDFPPFNFLLSDGQLAGFNVDLARAICAELDLPCTHPAAKLGASDPGARRQ